MYLRMDHCCLRVSAWTLFKLNYYYKKNVTCLLTLGYASRSKFNLVAAKTKQATNNTIQGIGKARPKQARHTTHTKHDTNKTHHEQHTRQQNKQHMQQTKHATHNNCHKEGPQRKTHDATKATHTCILSQSTPLLRLLSSASFKVQLIRGSL